MQHRKKLKHAHLESEMHIKGESNGQKRRFLGSLLCVLLSSVLICVILLSVIASAGGIYVMQHPELFTVDPSLFTTPKRTASTELYYFKGGASDPSVDPKDAILLETITGGEKLIFCPLSEIPENLQNAFIAIEDKRFYEHHGVDLRRTGAAVCNYIFSRSKSFGGSTITQQLIKNVTGNDEKTAMRKITEIFRALDLEKNLGKEEILENYLNIVSLANGCTGIGSASAFYFGKSPSELSLSECASIAAITKSPSRYDPIRHSAENKTRRNAILKEMLLQNYITEKEYQSAVNDEITITNQNETDQSEKQFHSWYTDLVIEDVVKDLVKVHGYTRKEASRLIYHGGLKIYTPIIPALEKTLTAYYSDASNFPLLRNGERPESAMIVLDPKTGNILAVAGAIGEKAGDRVLNYATDSKRPPGSVLKPLSVYAPALKYGIAGYASVYDDVPVRFAKEEDGGYTMWPHNATNVYRGLSTVNYAISHSLNTVAVRVLQDVGIDRSFEFLKNQLGIESLTDGENGKTDRGLAALALGQMNYGTTPREITAAYTALANGGIYRNARSYLLVTDSMGRVLLDNEPIVRAVLSKDDAELLTRMLENVTESGTARSLTLKDEISVAGKTGTTQYSLDRWFVGYTPSLLAGVWYGSSCPDALSELKGNPALSTFDTVMKGFYELNENDFPSEKKSFSYKNLHAVRVCADSGLLISDACTLDPRGDRSTIGYFTDGTLPTTFCTCHTPILYSGTGERPEDGVVTEHSPLLLTRTVGLIRVNRSFPIEVPVSDAQYTAAPIGTVLFPSDDPRTAYYLPFLKSGTFVGKSYAPLPFNRPAKRRSS